MRHLIAAATAAMSVDANLRALMIGSETESRRLRRTECEILGRVMERKVRREVMT